MKKFFVKAMLLATLGVSTVSTLTSCSGGDDNNKSENTGTVQVDNTNLGGEKGLTLKSGDKLVLTADKAWTITGAVVVEDGGVLEIEPGTTITASGGTSAYVAVAQGGKIYSKGTAAKPVIFTATSKEKAAWGGIVLCGKAPINNGTGQISEVANLPYGGTVKNDNSGVITYTQIRYAGARINGEKEFNGLSLFGVGNGTTIEGVSVIDGSDDGIEFFGGTVNVSKIVSINNDDDAIDWTDGWVGSLTDAYAKRTNAKVGNRGIEADNRKGDESAEPRSNPTLKNITLIGYKTTDNEDAGTNLFRVGTYATLDNIVVSGWATGFTFKSNDTQKYFSEGTHITNVKFHNVDKKVEGISDDLVTKMENDKATGAGNGLELPDWAKGWSGY
ncbi:hypothetical protein KRX57_03605 [Weeksellaceae bacterium TAE3-ERU29]|nr:hypothetical protein [Weeksellaceae bacterium TAE3-ERU29]